MIIINRGKKDEMKTKLSRLFESPEIEIVWGDDPNYFYQFRSESKITIDFEIQEKDTDFYQQHPLLGCSIFAQYNTIYSNGQYLEDLLKLPYAFAVKKRFEILLNDRKGLNEFNQRLNTKEVDPRRIISLCIKNIAWAITGSRPLNTDVAINFLSNRWNDILPSVTPQEIKYTLLKSQSDIREDYIKYQNCALKMISDLLQFSTRNSENDGTSPNISIHTTG